MSQYSFVLPADYAMVKVRERVATRGPAFDTLPGLGWKAFLVREAGVAGATDNRYAPLYFWPHAEAATEFLLGPRFAAVAQAFGRPAVETGLLVRRRAGAAAGRPAWCTSERRTLRPHEDPDRVLAALDLGPAARLHSAWIALDAAAWTLTRHALWTGAEPPETPADVLLYEVAHFSQPA